MGAQTERDATPVAAPSIRNANLLYLLAMGLMVTVGAALQLRSFGWGLLGTELILLVVAVSFLRMGRLPLRETLRLRGLSPVLALLSLGIGAGIWLLAMWLDGVMSAILGYAVLGPPDMYPTNAAQAALLVAALAVAAPVCEEALFRGVIQRAYERLGPRRAVVFGGLLFALFHLRLSGLVAILPISLALGYVVYRSGSLLAGVLMHFANNLLAALALIALGLRPDRWETLPFPSPELAALGAAVAIAGLWLFRRQTARPAETLSPETSSPAARAWPLAVALLLYLAMGGIEYLAGRHPGLMATGQRVAYAEAPWQGTIRWRYELRNVLGSPVGAAECSLSSEGELLTLTCHVRQEAFQAQVGRSYWSSDSADWRTLATWRRADLSLVRAEGQREGTALTYGYRLTEEPEGLRLAAQGAEANGELLLPRDALLAYEWPWRLAALPFSLGYSREATVAWPLRWRPATQDNGPDAAEVVLTVRGAQPIHTPWGDASAWLVELDGQKAWYDARAPHHLMLYEDGFHTWVLVGAE